MQCYTMEKSEKQGTTLAFQIPKGIKVSSGLFSYSLYLHKTIPLSTSTVLLYSTAIYIHTRR